jgi:IS4 transposase
LLIHWKKPVLNKRSSYTKAQWEALPERLCIRQIRVTVAQKGFRTSHFYIATTLLDSELYPADDIADLYLQRWDVELSFRDIKTTMGMDILRCKTPDMVRKEIVMQMIVYNGIRQLMFESAQRFGAECKAREFQGKCASD